MSKPPIMSILQSQTLTGQGFRVERLVSSSAIEIWRSMKLIAAVKLGFINMLQT